MKLTPRERQIAEMIASECLYSVNIAARLGLAESTVQVHRSNLMEKLGVHSVMELCRWWWTARPELQPYHGA